MGEISVKTGNNARNGGKNSLNRLIRCVCGKKIGPDPRNFNQRVNLGRNDLLIRTFLSMWLLVGVGATATLMIANIDKVLPFITPLGFKISVFLLAISSIAGFASKYFALVVCSSATVTVRMTELIQSKIKEYAENCKIRDEIGRDVGYVSDIELSIDSFTEQYVSLFPFQGLRNKVKKGMNFYSENRSGNRAAVHGVVFQGIALFVQALSYIAFLIVITSFINLR
ncbi:hypothetical protein [Escherichia coli]|uniref:hypothetical protein n=1 Tax=Escherichia coli TaxID=562 RepID=UPI001C5B2FE2|nr:hypothetical protein [Escherichia coli]MBW4289712.1 hypothetical protein [Escherichia coli]HAW2736207.1 hypothetical protein [Escherichia coli]